MVKKSELKRFMLRKMINVLPWENADFGILMDLAKEEDIGCSQFFQVALEGREDIQSRLANDVWAQGLLYSTVVLRFEPIQIVCSVSQALQSCEPGCLSMWANQIATFNRDFWRLEKGFLVTEIKKGHPHLADRVEEALRVPEPIADTEAAHQDQLRRYRDLDRVLSGAKRKLCAFLSADVVDSTRMKVGEKQTDISATFQAYEDMLKETFKKNDAWKTAWTPDGVMVCFTERVEDVEAVDRAVAAAQSLLRRLIYFNESENKLRLQFHIRCGVNEGEVAIYEDSQLEHTSDHVIDLAGHMQKHANPDSLWISGEVYSRLRDKSGFHAVGTEVDGLQVYEWKPEPS